MNYKVLYRKYRPSTFEEIIGQKNIVKILQSSIIDNKIAHAYIFTGPRGTGKTSTAKVLAKTLNCQDLQSGEPCGKCQNCLDFNTSPDIIEIDAASNNGVDEIRELRNNITLAPSMSKYKIYIIDEVHMLSTGAFNALLKTLEEPPEHAIFILATTEIYKVPITILSRCQRYDFKKISKDDMVKYLKWVCDNEKIECDNSVLDEIYDLSDGCLRDALSILDQNSKDGNKIDLDELESNYELLSSSKIENLLNQMFSGNVEEVIKILDEIENSGYNTQKLVARIIKILESIAINIKLNKENRYRFDAVKQLIDDLNQVYISSRTNENSSTLFKIAILNSTANNTLKIENKNEVKLPEKQNNLNLSLTDIRINNCFCKADKEILKQVQEQFSNIKARKTHNINIKDYMPVMASDEYVIFTIDDESLADLFNEEYLNVEKVLKKEGMTCKVSAISSARWNREKQQYILNIKNKIEYKLIEEPIKKEKTTTLKKDAEQLFEKNIVEVS